jgi:hypothetical protein
MHSLLWPVHVAGSYSWFTAAFLFQHINCYVKDSLSKVTNGAPMVLELLTSVEFRIVISGFFIVAFRFSG